MLYVSPFAAEPSEKKSIPSYPILFSHRALSAPYIVSGNSREGIVAIFMPLLKMLNNCTSEVGSSFQFMQVCLEFKKGQSKGSFCPGAFTFHDVACAFRFAATRAFIMVLVTSHFFSSAYSAPAGSMFDQPPLPTKRELFHSVATCLPIDRCNEFR